MSTERRQSSWGFWARYLWPRAVSGCVLLLSAVVIALAIPHYLGRTIDALQHGRIDDVPTGVAILIVLALVQATVRISGMALVISAARAAEQDLRDHLFGHMIRLDAGFHRTHAAGDIVSRLTNDIVEIVQMWSLGVIWVVGAGLLIAFASVAMVVIAPPLALWALLPVPMVIFGAQRIAKVVKQHSTDAQTQLGKLSASTQEELSGIGVVRSYGLVDARTQKFAASSKQLVRTRMSAQLVGGLFAPLMSGFSAIGMLAVLWVGGRAAIHGEISLGTLVQFNAYLAMLAFRLVGLGDSVAMFQRGSTAWTRLDALLAYETTIVDGTGPAFDAGVRGEIELRGLTIELGGRRVLDGVSLHIPAGTTCAVVGRVGSGKSTLLDAIPRLVDVPAGSVFIDGRDITDLPLASLRRAVAYAPQSPFLFSATVGENIAFGFDDPDAPLDRERVMQAAEAAGLAQDLSALPSGLDTQVGERGITVSGGQRQRTALARTIASAGTRSIVVLDDSLASVDAETEHKVLDNLERELAGKTILMVSHRVAAVRRAHQIAVLDQGKLVELGTHDELLARDGVYAEIYRAQAEKAAA